MTYGDVPQGYPTWYHPFWQIPPQVDPFFPLPWVDGCTYTPDTTPAEAGYKIKWIDFKNGSNIIALVEPDEPKDGYTFHYNPDDYYHLVEYSEDMNSTSITFVKKPVCWGEYPGGHTECEDICPLRDQCRQVTYPHGKSDDNDLPYADEDPAELEPEDMPERIDDTGARFDGLKTEPLTPEIEDKWQKWIDGDAHPEGDEICNHDVIKRRCAICWDKETDAPYTEGCDHIDTTETCDRCGLVVKAKHRPSLFGHLPKYDTALMAPVVAYWRKWAEMMRSNGLTAMDVARTGSYTHEELDRIAKVLEGEPDGEDETQEPWYRESLDKTRPRHHYSR